MLQMLHGLMKLDFGQISELLWQIKDGHKFFHTPSIERKDLFILPLNLGWLVTALTNSIWQNDAIQVSHV